MASIVFVNREQGIVCFVSTSKICRISHLPYWLIASALCPDYSQWLANCNQESAITLLYIYELQIAIVEIMEQRRAVLDEQAVLWLCQIFWGYVFQKVV